MSRRDIGTDDPRVHVRPGKGSRPRTKTRPDYSKARRGRVTAIDRGRYAVELLDDGAAAAAQRGGVTAEQPENAHLPLPPTPAQSQAAPVQLTAVKAREIPRGGVAVGDVCAIVGDLSGREGTLARIAAVDPRVTELRRTAEDGDSAGNERVIVANADQMLIVTALAQPEPRLGFIDRCLVAAYDAGLEPILVLTKADLAPADALRAHYAPLDLRIVVTALPAPDLAAPGLAAADLAKLRDLLNGHVSVMIGQSGVGKSTLINALVPAAARATGGVNAVTGKGRHTSTSAQAFTLPPNIPEALNTTPAAPAAPPMLSTPPSPGTPLPPGTPPSRQQTSKSPAAPSAPTVVIDTPGVRGFGLAHVSAASLLRGFPDLARIAADCPRGCTHCEGELECALSEAAAASEAAAGSDAPDAGGLRTAARVASYRRLLESVRECE